MHSIANTYTMRYNIQEQFFQKWIEGPRQYAKANSSFEEDNGEKAAHHADFAQGMDTHVNEHMLYGLDMYKHFHEDTGLWGDE